MERRNYLVTLKETIIANRYYDPQHPLLLFRKVSSNVDIPRSFLEQRYGSESPPPYIAPERVDDATAHTDKRQTQTQMDKKAQRARQRSKFDVRYTREKQEELWQSNSHRNRHKKD